MTRLILLMVMVLLVRTHALEVHEQLASPALEKRAQLLGSQLLCPTCEGQSLNDSPIEEAILLRQVIREQIVHGFTDQQIIEWFTNRYGERILITPPLRGATLALWALPWILLGLCLGAGVYRANKKGSHRRAS
ncbi:cytochrome c-type biogenesis protein [Candidatus Odyssella thessalonicensis]|uniref:cytochrome c-type biogenesis protein n=1 Tax=Candidatus Odyssella thessalonicensis TaxID=84647 RepID=UPI000225C211|nr:cytochrome c-type biogenesis protein [Candidatus Odyssella thessalonicensis]